MPRRRWWWLGVLAVAAVTVVAALLLARPPQRPGLELEFGDVEASAGARLEYDGNEPLAVSGTPVWRTKERGGVVVGDLVVGAYHRGGRSALQAVEGTTGRVRWTLRAPKNVELLMDTKQVVRSGRDATLYVAATVSSPDGGHEWVNLVSIDVRRGRTDWIALVGGEHHRTFMERLAGGGDPLTLTVRTRVADGAIVVASPSSGYTGKERERAFDQQTGRGVNRPPPPSEPTSRIGSEQLRSCDDGHGLTVCLRNDNGKAVAFDNATGKRRWEVSLDAAGVGRRRTIDTVGAERIYLRSTVRKRGVVLDSRDGSVLRTGVVRQPLQIGNGFVMALDLNGKEGTASVGAYRVPN